MLKVMQVDSGALFIEHGTVSTVSSGYWDMK